ncbi:hypothetical protein, partial [Leptotrichia sp. oral taxon 879]|uniref:hypothetical protein n=1 Tax=Leptotrichia sp. oral taxon 879 TaxID=1227267 RepID=UPI0003ADA8C7
WTFSEENNQKDEYTVSDVNTAKVKSALTSAFLRRNKELGLAAGTEEYKKAFEKYIQDNFFISLKRDNF